MQAASDAQRSGMVAITGLSVENVHAACKAAEEKSGLSISIGNYLLEGNYVVSGAAEACDLVKDIAMAMGARSTTQLPVAGAFHTGFMQPAAAQLTAVLREVKISSPRIPVISNVDAKAHAAPDDIQDALVKQLVAPVQWETTMKNMLLAPEFEQCYEIGPGNVCKGIVLRIRKRAKCVSVQA